VRLHLAGPGLTGVGARASTHPAGGRRVTAVGTWDETDNGGGSTATVATAGEWTETPVYDLLAPRHQDQDLDRGCSQAHERFVADLTALREVARR